MDVSLSGGSLGDGTIVHKSSPVQVVGLTQITAVAAGSFHSFFLKSNGTIWATGNNSTAQLGDGTQVYKTIPLQITGACNGSLGTGENIIDKIISVYPNPCNDQLFIELEEYQNAVCEIFSLS